ncbi:MAG: SIMPL domain-containing protein [Nitrospirota bacterium]|jgi:uncharacterized protein YggE
MKRRPGKKWLVAAVALTALVPSMVAADDGQQQTPHLAVRGVAVLEVPADQLRLNVGVITNAVTAQEALDSNTGKMKQVARALVAAGLSDADYETGQFEIRPQWSPRPRNPAPDDWRPHIVGYTVTNQLRVKTTRIDLAGKLIGAASEAGANAIDSISFDLADPRRHRGAAIAAAAANAIANARALATASSVRLVRVLSLGLDEAAAVPRPVRPAMMAEAMDLKMAVAPPITAGDVTVRASVQLVYEIAEAQP